MERHAEKQTGNVAHVGVPLARGCVAFASGDYDRAGAILQPILNDVPCVGGSDEQRGVFAESHLVSLIRGWSPGRGAHGAQRTYRAPAGDRGRASMGRNDLMRLSFA
jgi:hypothetical protein